jgi:TP901 family phage tail tape measure protein
MADKISEFVLSLSGDDSDLRNIMSQFKSRLRSDVSDLQAIADKLDLFGQLSDSVPKVKAALDSARESVTALRDEIATIKEAGAEPTKALTDALGQAEAAARTAGAEFKRQTVTLEATRATLIAANVDVGNYGAAQLKMAADVKTATDALTLQNSKDLLGFKGLSDVQPKIDALQKAFETLKASGTLSASEIAAAQDKLNQKTLELQKSVSDSSQGFKVFGVDVTSIFDSVIAKVTSITVIVALLKQGFDAVTKAAEDFANAQARISTVTNATGADLQALGEGVRTVARDVGVSLNDAMNELYAILRTGVPKENAIDVLRLSAEAAIATNNQLTDTVKAADALMSAFGVGVTGLAHGFDVLTQAQRDSGLTLKEFGDNTGGLLNLARQANISLEDLVATLTVLHANGLSAGDAVQALTLIITKLGDPAVIAKLETLGVTVNGLSDTFQQMHDAGIDTAQKVTDLGLASERSAKGVATLFNNVTVLPAELKKLQDSAGATSDALDKLGDTPARNKAKFDAAWEDTKTNIGQMIGSSSTLAAVVADALNVQNRFAEALRQTQQEAPPVSERLSRLIENYQNLSPEALKAKAALDQATAAAKATGDTSAQTAADIKKASDALSAFSADLVKQVAAMNAATSKALTDINTVTAEQLASLDKGALGIAATAKQTIDIQTDAAAQRLKIITDNEAAVAKVTDDAIAARLKKGKDANQTQQQFEQELLNIRISSLAPIEKAYSESYSNLVQQAQGWANQLTQIEQGRVAFNEGIEKTLFDIRVSGLSAFDQYVAKANEADHLVSLARDAAANNDAATAEKYANQAIALAGGLTKAYSATGVEIVSQSQANQKKIDIVKAAQDAVNTAFTNAGSTASEGYTKASNAADAAKLKLDEVRKKLDELNEKAAKGLAVIVNIDEDSLTKATAKLDKALADRVVDVKVNFTEGGAGFVGPPSPAGGATGSFDRGGYVSRAPDYPQLFANGGGVGWRVPGFGERDTVPALLSAGSFVVRKAASDFYGGALSHLAQGFADGGIASRILGSGGGANLVGYLNRFVLYPDQNWVNNWENDPGANPTDADNLHSIKREADGFFPALLQWGINLPHSQFGDLSAYIQRAWDRLNAAGNASDAANILDGMKAQSDSFITTFRAAQQFHVPATQPVTATGLDDFGVFGQSSWSQAFGTGEKTLAAHLAARRLRYGYAEGGDVVPAMLTPGEWVINPRATAMLGSDLLHAVNQMHVAPGALARLAMRSPPAFRYAEGGPVYGASIPASSAGNGSGGIQITINAAGGDLTNPAVVRRLLLPVIREIERRST